MQLFQKRVSVKQRVRILCRDTYRCRHTSKWQRVGSCVRITRSNLTRLHAWNAATFSRRRRHLRDLLAPPKSPNARGGRP